MEDPNQTVAETIEVLVYEDPLCAWCYVIEKRILTLVEEFDRSIKIRHVPFPMRPEPRVPSSQERKSLVRTVKKAAKQAEGQGIVPELWLSPDPPSTSIPALSAIWAARIQGASRETAMRAALRDAALFRGVNVSRSDVIIEIAERIGLDMSRFTAAFSAPATERAVRAVHQEAVEHGIDELPAVVIADEWLIAGARDLEEYRSIFKRYLSTRAGLPSERTVH